MLIMKKKVVIKFKCPSCRAKYAVSSRQGGKKKKCKNCGVRIIVPRTAKR